MNYDQLTSDERARLKNGVWTMNIRTKPVPYCPDCGAQMKLRLPRINARTQWTPFWGCSEYPECDATRQICEDGTPEEDDH